MIDQQGCRLTSLLRFWLWSQFCTAVSVQCSVLFTTATYKGLCSLQPLGAVSGTGVARLFREDCRNQCGCNAQRSSRRADIGSERRSPVTASPCPSEAPAVCPGECFFGGGFPGFGQQSWRSAVLLLLYVRCTSGAGVDTAILHWGSLSPCFTTPPCLSLSFGSANTW